METNNNTKINSAKRSKVDEGTYKNLLHNVIDSEGKINAEGVYSLAYFIAHSVLKKCIAAGQTAEKTDRVDVMKTTSKVKDLATLKAQVTAFSRYIDRIEFSENTLSHEYNEYGLIMIRLKDGTIKLKEAKKTRYNDVSPVGLDTMDKGQDLVQTIVLQILEAIKGQKDRGQEVNLESTYEFEKVGQRIFIGLDRPKDSDIKTDVTTPIQNIYRATHRYIYSESKKVDTSRFTYSQIADSESYLRNLYGLQIYENADRMERIKADVYARLQLTDRQKEVVEYRLQNYSLKAIAEKMNTSVPTVCKTLKRIAEKYNKIYGTSYGMTAKVVDSAITGK